MTLVPGRTAFDRYSREVLRLLEGGVVPRNVALLRRVDSTQRLCRRVVRDYLAEDEPVPTATLVAYEQSAGRGRQGRPWRSPPGQGVYMTLVRTVEAPSRLAWLPLLAGICLVEAVNPWVDGRCRLKWPNDLLVDGRKIGGILIDAITRPGEAAVVFLGLGVNRGRKGSAPLLPQATSLALESASPPTLARLASAVLISLEEAWPKLEDPVWLLDRYREVSAHRPGQEISCRVGEIERQGIFRGFDDQGRLLLQSAQGELALSSGEVFFGRGP